MGLFNRKEKKSESGSEVPSLPKLPRLPEIPDVELGEDRTLHRLPSFPSNSAGKRFSQDSIKDAVSGGREGEDFYADEFSDDMRRMRRPLRRPMTEEMDEDVEMRFPESRRDSFIRETEPVFVRIDRFEEGLRLFEGVRDQLTEIEKVLSETRRLKEKEESELRSWENELKRMKMDIEKIGRDIFSKV